MKRTGLILLGIFFFCLSNLLAAEQSNHVPGEILLRLKPGTDVRAWAVQHQYFQQKPTQFTFREVVVAQPMQVLLFTFNFTAVDEHEFLNHLRKDKAVIAAQFNHLLKLRSTIPNDPLFDQQWQFVNTGQSGGTPDADFDIDLAWDLTTGGVTATGDTIVVCIIDDGIQLNHNDFGDNLWVNKFEIPNNGLDDDNNGYIDDFQGWNPGSNSDNVGVDGSHGTPVAGIVGAKGDNNLGVTGVNWKVKLMIVRNSSGLESDILAAYAYPLIQRMRYNETNGAEGAFVVVTNASWGIDFLMPDDAPLWCAYYDSLGVHGILSAVATTNDEVDVDEEGDLPTLCPSDYMIAVTNVDHNDNKVEAGFGTLSVDLGAFGEDVFTTALGNSYSEFGGTSAAAPHVSGAIALMYSLPCPAFMNLVKEQPGDAALLLKQFILDGVAPNESLEGITLTGGRMNIFNSMLLLNQTCGDCPEPLNVNVSDLTDMAASLNWTSNDSINQIDLRWRNIGAIEWNLVENVSSPYALSDLSPCTGYEFQLKTYCNQDTLDFGENYTIKTDGCCVPPTQVDFAQSSSSSPVLASWESILAAESYNIRIREGALGEWMTFSTGEPSFVFENLMSCTNYQIQVQTVCENLVTDFGPTQFLLTLGCGACTEVMYCQPLNNNSENEWIAEVNLSSLNNSSASDDGYGDYTNLPATQLAIGEDYTIQLEPGFAAQAFNEYFKVWIDYDQDGNFENNENVFDAGMASSAIVDGEFTIPIDAELGITRMRVVMQFNSPGGPCQLSGLAFGEMEDYCVEIIPGELGECDIPSGLDTVNVSTNAANLQWSTVPAALNYLVRYRPVGQEIWTVLTAMNNDLTLQGLSFCTEYEAQVRSVCNDGGSDYSASFIFSTSCSTALKEENTIAKLQVFPNPFSDQFTLGFELQEAVDWLNITVYNTQGQVIYQKHSQPLSSGNHFIPVNIMLPAGIYYVYLATDKGMIAVEKLVRI